MAKLQGGFKPEAQQRYDARVQLLDKNLVWRFEAEAFPESVIEATHGEGGIIGGDRT
ncbi:MAG: hypothetical protein Q7S85_01070 [Rugosibacter sp.]|nr:hypothetical protein [Rugosibacter sp.]